MAEAPTPTAEAPGLPPNVAELVPGGERTPTRRVTVSFSAMAQPTPLRNIRHLPNLTERTADDLRRAIQEGHFGESGRLPAEPELAAQLGVSRGTLRHAISVLQEEGLVQRRHGSGTYVTGRLAELRNNLSLNFGVTDLIKAAGWRPGIRDMVVEEARADPETADRLGVPQGSRLLVVHRTFLADGRPVARTSDMVPADRLPVTVGSPEDLRARIEAAGTLTRALAQLGVVVHHGIAEMKPARTDRRLSKVLDVPLGSLLLEMDQVDSDADEVAIVRCREWYLAEVFRFYVYRKGTGELP
jgi:GntR family transcriptional regulator